MRRFGTDKPDLRIPWEIEDCTDELSSQNVPLVSDDAYKNGKAIMRTLVARGAARAVKSSAKKEWSRLISLLPNPQVRVVVAVRSQSLL